MEGVLSQHPHFAIPVDAHAYPSRSYSSASLYDNFLQQSRYAQQSLQIQTAAPAPHEHDPEEQTAHPSRSSTAYPPIPQDADIEPHEQSIADALTTNPGPYGGLSRPLTLQERELLAHLDRLKFFLATAPSRWNADNGYAGPDPSTVPPGHPHSPHPALNRFLLPNAEYVSCVLWGGLYHITGTDIVRALVFRFEAFGRPVRNMKKFEEGVFSDLRNLKPGVDACLEEPKSPFLDLLFKYQCIRTQKKQKVFYWFSVPHDRLFLDPALSFTYDPKRSLYEQFSKAQGHREGEGELEAAVRHADEQGSDGSERAQSVSDAGSETDDATEEGSSTGKRKMLNTHSPFFSMFSLFEGSPTYKQRRKKVPKARKSPTALEQATLGMGDFGLYSYREPHLDRFGRETVRLSAEDMFRAQARGDFGGQSNPDLIATQKERQRRALEALSSSSSAVAASGAQAKLSYLNGLGVSGLSGPGIAGGSGSQAGVYDMAAGQLPVAMAFQSQQQQQTQAPQQFHQQMGGRPHIEQRHTYPMLDYSQQQQQPHMAVRSDTDPYSVDVAGWTAGAEMLAGGPGAPRTKAFVCPLFSCGRMFKRMEHLKRHLRTHTLERPFQCEQCQKRFSRSDNLAQHVRTHDRRAAAAGSGLVTPEGEQEPEELMIDELEGLGDADDVDAQLRYLPGVKGITSVQMCEVEVQGQVHDVQGDEEGLVTTTGAVNPSMAAVAAAETSEQQQQPQQQQQSQPQEMYYDPSAAAVQYDVQQQQHQVLRASPETSPYMNATTSNSPDAQWATIAGGSQQPSPASSVTSGFPTSTGLALQHQQRLDTSYHTHPGTMGEYVTSISAPSHKLSFDHASLYPPEVVAQSQQQGPGPIRRHRSATPSVARYGESIRRPYSAALSESAQSTHTHTHSPRSYHPYAVPGHHHAHSHSAQSSPLGYTVPLEYDAAQHQLHQHRPQHVRSSSAGMMGVQVDAGAMTYGYAGPVRTDSPMQMQYATTAVPAPGETYEMDITQPTAVVVQDVQGMYSAVGVGMEAQYAASGQPMATGYYSHPHHSL
ncbi:STE-domain-containing protein [Lentinus brumalis]|uniref:STE-domain-containing protein n=1 Tax=Lentinus brumalis TaxID=2498619 RepID=A0A371D0E1_9APHY|nr:STE-domain-containing protein [Polyporus brumalis]